MKVMFFSTAGIWPCSEHVKITLHNEGNRFENLSLLFHYDPNLRTWCIYARTENIIFLEAAMGSTT